jgi:outer membrane protein with beta-barrel domain
MRRTGVIFILALIMATSSFAQTSVELIPTVGYTFANRTDYYNSYGRINDGLSLGGSLKFNINQSTGIEILYSHMNTSSGLYPYGYDTKLSGTDLTFDYIMLGAVQSFGIPNSTVRPFVGGFLGAAIMTPGSESGYTSDTKFAVGVQLGTNIYFTPQLGLQLKAQMLAPVDVVSSGLYFSNYGSGGGISTYSDIYQFSLSAGLIIGLGRVLPQQTYHRSYRPGPRHYRYYY